MSATKAVIAIDGPGAVGKSTVGRLLARSLGLLFVDTGLMYRAVTWAAIDKGLEAADPKAVGSLARLLKIEIRPAAEEMDASSERLLVNGQDISEEIKRPEVDRQVSIVSRHRGVRKALVRQQRALAAEGGIVMVGRDIGTVVLPQATLKVFLTASPKERAKRRYRELKGFGLQVHYPSILRDLRSRDKIDSERSESPLVAAADAHSLDTTSLSPDQVVQRIMELLCSANG